MRDRSKFQVSGSSSFAFFAPLRHNIVRGKATNFIPQRGAKDFAGSGAKLVRLPKCSIRNDTMLAQSPHQISHVFLASSAKE